MTKIKYLISEVYPKSHFQASEDCDDGSVPFYTSSQVLTKYCKNAIYPANSITMGTGGFASVNYVDVPFSTSTDCLSFRAKNIDTTKYLYYSILGNIDIIDDLGFRGMGLRHLQKDFLFNMKINDSNNKKGINSFLDSRITTIDSFISKEESATEKLMLYRTSFISKIVTCGINKHDFITTNNKWFEQIPQGWKIMKIRHILNLESGIKVGPFGSSLSGKILYEPSDVKVYGQWNVIAGDYSIDRNFVNYNSYKELINYEVKSGDILISMMGTIGKCKTVPDGIPVGIMDSHIIKIRLSDKMLPKYFEYLYDRDNSCLVSRQLDYLKKGSIMDGLNSTILKEVFICVPPIEEQKEIVNYLDKKIKSIDSIIELKHKKIELLKAYKKSLIYECITGKKEVSHA